VEEGRLEEAVPLLEQVRAADPANPQPLWMLAVARLRLGDLPDAVLLAAEFGRLVPDNPNGPLLAASALTALGRLSEAEAALEEALTRDPRHPEGRRDLAVLLGRRGELEEAVRRLEALQAEYPGRPEALAPLGVLYVQQGRGAEGLSALTRAAQADPALFEARHHLGALLSELGQFAPAGAHLEAALELRPGNPGTLFEICLLRSREERLEEARAACAEAAREAPESAEAQFANGDVLHYLQEGAEAERAYREAIRLDPGHARARFRLGLLLHEAGRSSDAIPVLTPAVEDPERAPGGVQLAGGLTTLGQALAANGDPDEAARRLEAAIAAAPSLPEPHLHLGNLLVRSGDAERVASGREHLERFRELKSFSDRTNELKAMINANPAAPEPKKALIAHLIRGGAPALALEEAGRLLALADAEPLHHLLYVESLAALGRRDEALGALDRALSHWPANAELQEAATRLGRNR
jgi:tetratricopeptide (TPR) repeat protein